MLDIEGNDIKELSDVDLRSLIGLLCEAELRAKGLPTAGVTWGGHQNAKDGGIDVRVELSSEINTDNFLPRSHVGLQVKKPDMPRAEILNEMCPNGKLRQVIKDLIHVQGAYIIVSSQGSTADSSLNNRRNAMQEAIKSYIDFTNFIVDFYDRERIANWVRSHPSLILWVKDKIGRPIQGWRPYGNWSNSPNGESDEYILDNHTRLKHDGNPSEEGYSAKEGINNIRKELKKSASSIRLVGLSGVGKTRFLQGLFDEGIGENPLNKSQVFYTDISDSPYPDPRHFAEQLIALRVPAILAIDNCPPNLHRSLTSLCTSSGSLVSLITVEYDVGEDQPEETNVFRLEPSSNEIIEKIILNRFAYINQIDARSIAEFSGGNARIALALANTIRNGESVAALKDNELFSRLFVQRNDPNNSLRKTAEACSLVYSFNSHTREDENLELKLLSELADLSIRDVYENIRELQRRELVQQRSIWRAVLPHAIANKLAERALENIPIDFIINTIEMGGSERLLKSFSKRLSYLHKSEIALEISGRWLSEDGLIGNLSYLNDLKINLLSNIAPVNPLLILKSIEKVKILANDPDFFTRKNPYYNEITRLLRSITYDKELFERAIVLLCDFALSEKPSENYNSIRKLVKSLFHLYLSGTHSTSGQRLTIIKNLIESANKAKIDLGFLLLDATLKSGDFTSFYNFEFGAHSRDYGYTPSNGDEVYKWYKLFIDYTVSLATSFNSNYNYKATAILANKFRGLLSIGMIDVLEKGFEKIAEQGEWNEGWLAVKSTLKFDGEKMDKSLISRLNNLGELLKPKTLIEKAKLYALSNEFDLIKSVHETDDTREAISRVRQYTKDVGCHVAENQSVLEELLPVLLSNGGTGLFYFGKGLAEGSESPLVTWRNLCEQLSKVAKSNRNFKVMYGFLNFISKIDRQLYNKVLNEAVTDSILAEVYPSLQTSGEITKRDIERLKDSLRYNKAPIWQYCHIGYGSAHEPINDDNLIELLGLISNKPEGDYVAIEILKMRLHGKKRRN